MAPGPIGTVQQAGLSDDDLASMAQNLKILGNQRRLQLLQYLVTPHYIQEIASELGIARQSAQAHVDKLVDIGVLERRRGQRETGSVTDYVVAPQRLFAIQESFGRLGHLEPVLEEPTDKRAVTEHLDPPEQAGDDPPVSRLLIVHGQRIGQATALAGQGPWLLGRDPAADLCLDYDPYVSTRHAEVRRRDDGTFEVADLYSRNGTTVDFAMVERGQARPLEPGAVIGLGRTLVVLRTP